MNHENSQIGKPKTTYILWLDERGMKTWVRARHGEAESEERRAVIARRETLVRELKDKYYCRALHARSIVIDSGRALSIA